MLLTEIRRNQKLAAKRNPAFDRNRFAKFLIYLFTAFWAAYLVLIGVSLSFAFEEDIPGMEPYDALDSVLILFLLIDFLIRFLFPTPAQEIKPYLLLPVSSRKATGHAVCSTLSMLPVLKPAVRLSLPMVCYGG